MFPTANSQVYYNEAGEPLGWEPYDEGPDPLDDDGYDTDAEEDPPTAWEREETEFCEKGTQGCSVLHAAVIKETECAPW